MSATRYGGTSSVPAVAFVIRRRRFSLFRPPRSGSFAPRAAKYPADQRVRRLIAELRARSELFAALWESGAVARPEASRKTIDHPQVGPLTLDCDVLDVVGPDMRIMIYSAEPGTLDAERLALLAVLGTQSLVEARSST